MAVAIHSRNKIYQYRFRTLARVAAAFLLAAAARRLAISLACAVTILWMRARFAAGDNVRTELPRACFRFRLWLRLLTAAVGIIH